MRFIRKDAAVLLGCLILLFLLLPAVSHGDDWNWSTKFMVSQASEVPGLILQPNTKYVMRLHDSVAERRVVQVFNENQTKMLTMFMAAADERTTPASETVFTFIETRPGYPLPIKEWFYPGNIEGLEFIYPKAQAEEIAEHALEPVQKADAGTLHDLASIEVEAGPIKGLLPSTTTASIPKLSDSTVVEAKPSAPAAPEPLAENPVQNEQQPEQIAQNNDTNVNNNVEQDNNVEPAATSETSTAPQELPRTAGELPLISLIGLLCVGGGLGLRVLSSKS